MSKASREKGKRGEREVAAVLTKILGRPIGRQLGQERDGGADIKTKLFAFQVKRCERLNLPAWIEQAVQEAGSTHIPVVAYRQNEKPWRYLVVCNLEALTDIVGGMET